MNNHKWLGRWIGAQMTVEDRFAPIFKKDFTVSKEIEKAEIYICGLGLFELKINGSLPDDTVLNPAHSQYSQTVLYRVFNIKNLLVNGENTVTVELGNSFFNETTPIWDWHTASWRSAPKLIADVVISYADGSSEIMPTGTDWLVTLDGPITANSIYLGETYDARRTEYTWQNAVCIDAPEGQLKAQYMPPIRRINEFKPMSISKLSSGSFIVTVPEMVTGWAKIRISAAEGTEVYITYGEKLTDSGAVQKIGKYEGHGGEWWPESYIQRDCFISNGDVFEYEPKFSYKGFKYIQIDGVEALTSDDITIYRIANDVEIISDFSCSDEMLNKLHRIMRNTLLNNFQGKPTDTPVWEKNGWLGDANCALPIMMMNFDMSTYLESFVDIMADCLHEYGSVPVIVPSASWSIENSPVWNSVFVFAVQALMDYCGENEYAQKLYPDLKEYAQKNIEELKDLGWAWGTRALADWVAPIGDENAEVEPDPSEGAEICCTAFIYAMLKSMVYIAEKLGEADDIAEYKSAMSQICRVFNEKFFNHDLKIYETSVWNQKGTRTKYRQTSNLLPLAFGLVPEEHKKAVAENLAKDFISRDYHLDTGCTGTRFVLPVLADNGYSDIAFKVLMQKTYPSWGHWLQNGTDSAWESWEKTTRSKNHYFLATYDEFFYTHIAGIRNVSDGYRSFTVEPMLDCGLEFAKTSVKTPLGLLRCEWKKAESGYEVEIEIPEGAAADIVLGNIRTTQSGGIKIYNV
ncbi:MAG: family 78 glycoside hydrolase catalytic domain [Clostridia bacterium]|nr:family 78 glycoside hydrolase catalytic domain [Clostridia bacterium]